MLVRMAVLGTEGGGTGWGRQTGQGGVFCMQRKLAANQRKIILRDNASTACHNVVVMVMEGWGWGLKAVRNHLAFQRVRVFWIWVSSECFCPLDVGCRYP